jgi:uracil-DNA glycosylase family 4
MPDTDPQAGLLEIVRHLRARVENERASGVAWVPRGAPPDPARVDVREARRATEASPRPRSVPPSGLFRDSGLAESGSLEALSAFIGDCRRCKLAGGRTHLVFGVGNPNADLMFVGEGPGRDEDLRGEPFVGRAGQLLTEIITRGMKLRREDVYIANVVKCRPPDNRNPEPDEIRTCIPFLERQIELVAPRVLVALGTFAAQTLLGVRTPISRLRGNWHFYRGIQLMPTLHPAYLLRNPADKRLVWSDIQQVMTELGLRP